MAPRRIAEGRLAHAVLGQAVEVDVAGDEMRRGLEAFGLRDARPVLVDQAMPIPCEIGGRFALPCCAVEIRGQASCRLARRKAAAIIVLAHRDVRRGQIRHDGRAREGGVGRRRDRDPEVFADFGIEREQRMVLSLEQQSVAEGHPLAEQIDIGGACGVGRGELAQLIELAVVRQVGLGCNPEDAPLVDDDRTVEEHVVDLERYADDRDNGQAARCFDHPPESVEHGIEQGLLVEEVVAGIGREPQFREYGKHGLVGRCLFQQHDGLRRVVRRIGDPHHRDADRDPREAVPVEVEELAVDRHRQEGQSGIRRQSPDCTMFSGRCADRAVPC